MKWPRSNLYVMEIGKYYKSGLPTSPPVPTLGSWYTKPLLVAKSPWPLESLAQEIFCIQENLCRPQRHDPRSLLDKRISFICVKLKVTSHVELLRGRALLCFWTSLFGWFPSRGSIHIQYNKQACRNIHTCTSTYIFALHLCSLIRKPGFGYWLTMMENFGYPILLAYIDRFIWFAWNSVISATLNALSQTRSRIFRSSWWICVCYQLKWRLLWGFFFF